MNKKIICMGLISLFLLSSFSIYAVADETNDDNVLTINYSFCEPAAQKIIIDNTLYDKVEMKNAPCVGNTGEPLLPAKGAYILIPSQTKCIDIVVSPGEMIHLGTGFNIPPVSEMIPYTEISTEKKLVCNQVIYNSDTVFPESFFTKIGVFNCRGYNILVLKLFPVKYNPVSGDIFYYKDLTVKVSLEESDASSIIRNSINDKNIVQNKVDNSRLISTYDTHNIQTSNTDNYKFVIITSEELKNDNGQYSFNDLKNKRISQGISTTIVSVEEIVSNPDFYYDGIWGDMNPDNPFLSERPKTPRYDNYYNDTAAKIRNFIRYAYSEWGTEYVLLGGDTGIIPERDLLEYDGACAGDIYYSCLHGSYNNCNQKNAFGHWWSTVVNDQIDLLGEVAVGRACVDNPDGVYNFTSKVLKYTEYTKSDPYLRNSLFLGEILVDSPYIYGSDYLEQLIEGSDYGGYSTVGFSSKIFNILEWYEEDYDWTTRSRLINRLNKPNDYIHIINHDGHAKTDLNMNIEIEDIDKLKNEKPFFVYSVGCFSGEFDNSEDDCFAEYITVKTEYGAFAGIWNSHFGYFSLDDRYDCAANRFLREFWDAIFNEDEGISSIGWANQDSKEDNLWRLDEEYMRKTYYELNLFGDPTISFIELEPKVKNKNVIEFKDNFLINKINDFLNKIPFLYLLIQARCN
jgi:hypothetical protein